MSSYYVEESAIIHASSEHVYAIISDYNKGHQAILPRRYFKDMQVVKGGKGEGTEIVVEMSVLGVDVTYHMTVTEPEPGRILKESDATAGVSTTFTVDSVDERNTNVTIGTTTQMKPGIMGKIEKWMNPPIMRRIYREELANLDKVAQSYDATI